MFINVLWLLQIVCWTCLQTTCGQKIYFQRCCYNTSRILFLYLFVIYMFGLWYIDLPIFVLVLIGVLQSPTKAPPQKLMRAKSTANSKKKATKPTPSSPDGVSNVKLSRFGFSDLRLLPTPILKGNFIWIYHYESFRWWRASKPCSHWLICTIIKNLAFR